MSKSILLVSHRHREEIKAAAALTRAISGDLGLRIVEEADRDSPPDLVLALGGDGTILGAAEFAHELDIPLLGINFGHMGFLAETSGETLPDVLSQVARADYSVDPRMTLRVVVRCPGGQTTEDWALNEAVVLHTDMARPAEFAFAVDHQIVSTYAADGIILATPTGSTAYAYSAGGPVVWPDTEAIVMAPLAAHGLFTRPLVVSPQSFLEVGVLAVNREIPRVWLDGRRAYDTPPGSTVEVTKGAKPLMVVRLGDTPFSKRLVTKFNLPVSGWRENGFEAAVD
ncbi:NAD kinase [Actinomycetaceae bacterium MB13-C1-2]|nr:NAD kinase [Actinomycetaceae bacterium MB13-C1-2]